MPSITSVTLRDRAATPVDHVFVPENASGGVGSLVERLSSGSFVGEPKLVAGNRITPSRRGKADVKLTIPKVVTEVINGVNVPKVVDTSYITLSCDWGQQFTAAERDVILGMVSKLSDTAVNQPFLNKVLLVTDRVYG